MQKKKYPGLKSTHLDMEVAERSYYDSDPGHDNADYEYRRLVFWPRVASIGERQEYRNSEGPIKQAI